MASFQSSATIYDVCFNHFFRARNEQDGGDWFTSRATSPRAFTLVLLEGRLTQEQLDNFRQEVHGNGLSSYPHETDAGILAVPRPYLWGWVRLVLFTGLNS